MLSLVIVKKTKIISCCIGLNSLVMMSLRFIPCRILPAVLFIMVFRSALPAHCTVHDNAASMEAMQIMRASNAISSLDRSAKTIACIQAAARLVPVLNDYAVLCAGNRLDFGDSLKMVALKACADSAEHYAGKYPEVLARTLYNISSLQGSYYDNRCIQTIDKAISLVKGINTARESLLLYKIGRQYFLRRIEDENPMRIKEIFGLEKEFVKYYKDHSETLDKADMMHMLAMMKERTEFVNDFKMATDSILFSDKDIDRTHYDTVDVTGIETNSPYYYRESLAIMRRLLGNDSPDTMVPWINCLITGAMPGNGAALVASADSVVAMAERYLPKGHPMITDIKAMRDNVAASNDYPLRFGWKYLDEIFPYAKYYGINNKASISLPVIYGINLSMAAGASYISDVKNIEFVYDALAKSICDDDPGQYIMDKLYFMQAYEKGDGSLFTSKLSALISIALSSSSRPSWSLFVAVRRLANTCYNNGRIQDALTLTHRLIANLDVLTGGKVMPISGEIQFELAVCTESVSHSSDSIKSEYEKSLRLYAEAGVLPTMLVIRYGQYLNSIGDFNGAVQKFEALLKLDALRENSEDRAYVNLLLGQAMLNAGVTDSDSLSKVFSEAERLYMTDSVKLNSETIRGYIYLSYYYNYLGCKKLSEKALRKGWELAKKLCIPSEQTPIDFNNELFRFYFSQGNEHEAEIFNEQNITAMETAGQKISDMYIEALWNRYLIINWRTPNDINASMSALMEQMYAISSLYKRTGQSPYVLYNYLLRTFTAAVGLVVDGMSFFKKSGIEQYKNMPEYAERYKKAEEILNKVLAMFDGQAIPLMHKMEKELPNYLKPYDYRSNPVWVNLINSLMKWYGMIKNNKQRELYYLNLVAESYAASGIPWYGDRAMAEYYFKESNWQKAYEYILMCYKQMDKFNEFEKIQIGGRIAILSKTLHRDNDAVNTALEQAGRIRSYVLAKFDYMSSNERAEFLDSYGSSSQYINNILSYRPVELSGVAYDAALFDKGLLLHSWERLRRSILRSGDKTLVDKLDTLDMLNKKKRGMDVVICDTSSSLAHSRMQRSIDGLEKWLSQKTVKFRSDTMRVVSWQDVKNSLKDNEAAVEFVFGDSSIMALVVRSECERPRYVRLCNSMECYEILHKVETFPADTRVRRIYTYGRSKLYDMIWAPLEGELRGVKTVYYSPTAFLNRVAFAALPVSADSCLSDRYDLHQLSTTALLAVRGSEKRVNSAALFGGINYGDLPRFMSIAADSMRAAISVSFQKLDETYTETEAIAKDMAADGVTIDKYMGDNATEANFYKLDGNSPDIIHLATHGFYISYKDAQTNAFLLNHPGSFNVSMQRTGLAFAGANTTWMGEKKSDDNDGIMTANELSMLDLSHTNLVVLSACETALGDYSLEGVYGLQRGFKEAGVRSMILSLWNVNDQATSIFMQNFYHLWLSGMSKHDAFRQAVTNIRATYPSPFYWAAFVLLDAE